MHAESFAAPTLPQHHNSGCLAAERHLVAELESMELQAQYTEIAKESKWPREVVWWVSWSYAQP